MDRLELRIAGMLIDEVPVLDDDNTRLQVVRWKQQHSLQWRQDWAIYKIIQSRPNANKKTSYDRSKAAEARAEYTANGL